MNWTNQCHFGDCRDILRRAAADGLGVHTCVTSPPYFGLRDYGVSGQIGLEKTPDEYVAAMVEVFRYVRDVLAHDGTLWLNLGDSYARSPGKGQHKPGDAGKQNYVIERGNGRSASECIPAGLKEKDLMGIPWRVAFALQADGWYLRQDIIWHKPNPMPESVTDRCTKAHEYLFLLSKSERYYYDAGAIKEPAVYAASGRESKKRGEFVGKGQPAGREPFRAITETRNRRSVWTVPTKPYRGAHFATFPPALIEPCILAGSTPGGVVLDPFMGSGTVAEVCARNGRSWIGCELNPAYGVLQNERIARALV